jgi:hypothetical protein
LAVDPTSVECLFSIPPLEGEEEEDEIQRRWSVLSQSSTPEEEEEEEEVQRRWSVLSE